MSTPPKLRGKWLKLNPQGSYEEFKAKAGDRGAALMVMVLRECFGPSAAGCSDESVWNLGRDLNAGKLQFSVKFGEGDQFEVRREWRQ